MNALIHCPKTTLSYLLYSGILVPEILLSADLYQYLKAWFLLLLLQEVEFSSLLSWHCYPDEIVVSVDSNLTQLVRCVLINKSPTYAMHKFFFFLCTWGITTKVSSLYLKPVFWKPWVFILQKGFKLILNILESAWRFRTPIQLLFISGFIVRI
jgi:hypothetical protein